MEQVTWSHLGIHDKPCGVLNTDGFYDPLLGFLAQGVDLGFIAPHLVEALVVSSDPNHVVAAMSEARSSESR
jgi:predicted Rossmann-fold nucleotide-binding protein